MNNNKAVKIMASAMILIVFLMIFVALGSSQSTKASTLPQHLTL